MGEIGVFGYLGAVQGSLWCDRQSEGTPHMGILTKDPTTKLKNKPTQTLMDIKPKGGFSDCN